MKIAALVIIWAASAFTGFYRTFLLKRRKTELEKIIKTIEYAASKICYEKCPLTEVFAALPKDIQTPLFRNISGKENAEKAYNDFYIFKKDEMCLKECDFGVLSYYFSSLGTQNLESQLVLSQKTISELSVNRTDAENIYNKYARLFMSSGVLLGTIAVILMI